MVQIVFLVWLTSLLASHIDASNVDRDEIIREKFDAFKKKYNKVYIDSTEEKTRYAAFQENDKLANNRNFQESATVHGVTKFSDLTPAEFSELFLTRFSKYEVLPKAAAVQATTGFRAVETTALIDWTTNYTTSIKNQGACGSCSAFAAVEQLESDSLRVLGLSSEWNKDVVKLSPQQVVSCSKYYNGCGGGGLIDTAFNYIQSAGGLAYDAYYPYTSGETGQADTCVNFVDPKFTPAVTFSAFNAISGETTTVADYVTNTGPVIVYIDATALQTYTNGVLTVSSCPAVESYVNHAVQIVGVLASEANGYWKLRNQWGSDWGEDGFARISFGNNTCNAFQFFSYYTSPQLLPSHWTLTVEQYNVLVFRYLNPTTDKRIAFQPGVYRDFGTSRSYPNEANNILYSNANWLIVEEAGVLAVRDMSSTKDSRYAFFPGSSADFGVNTNVGEFGVQVLFKGFRWTISIDNGVLVFRDNLSSGDHRFLFYQSYVDVFKA